MRKFIIVTLQLFCILNAQAIELATDTSDSLILVDLYNSAGGKNWDVKWNLAKRVGTWGGVVLSSIYQPPGTKRRVIRLNMTKNNLVGTIPTSFGGLTELTYLTFATNSLTGMIPHSLGKLSKVTSIDLSSNQLEGGVPEEIADMTELAQLNLNHNNLSGKIPIEIASLSKLKYLSMEYNMFNFDAFEEIVPKLRAKPVLFFTLHQHRLLIHNNGGKLSVTAGGTLCNNTYIWYDGYTSKSSKVGDSTFVPVESKSYYVRVTNAILKNDLALDSDTVSATIDPTPPCANDDVLYVEQMLGNPQNFKRQDYHVYKTDNFVCDPKNTGSHPCSIQSVYEFMKTKAYYQVPTYDDFPASFGSLCLPDINLTPALKHFYNPYTKMIGAAFDIYKFGATNIIASDLNVPIANCMSLLLAPTPARLIAGATVKVISVLNELKVMESSCDANVAAEPVMVVVDDKNYRITNYTLTGHFLFPGKVERSVVQDSCDGPVRIVTRGTGLTLCGNRLSGAFVADVNVCTGVISFNNVDKRLIADFNK